MFGFEKATGTFFAENGTVIDWVKMDKPVNGMEFDLTYSNTGAKRYGQVNNTCVLVWCGEENFISLKGEKTYDN